MIGTRIGQVLTGAVDDTQVNQTVCSPANDFKHAVKIFLLL